MTGAPRPDHKGKRPLARTIKHSDIAEDGNGLIGAPLAADQPEVYRSLFDQINDAVLLLSPDFRVLHCNASAERLFGWSSREAAGQLYRTVAGTDVTEAERRSIHSEILSNGSWNGEIICTNRSGKRFIVYVSWSVLRDKSGRADKVVGIHRDITAPKQMEQALRETEDRLALVHQALALGTWEVDLDTEQVRCSDQQLRLYGIFEPRGPFALSEWWQIVHPDDRPTNEESQRAMETSDTFDRQLRVIWPDGSIHWLHTHWRVVNQQGERHRIIGADFEITRQKQAEHARAQLASIVENTDAAIISADAQGQVLTWNAGAERLYGYSAEEMIGRSVVSIIPAEKMIEHASFSEKLQSGESIIHVETVRLKKSGERLPIFLTLSPIWDAHKRFLGVAHVSEDISHIKELERQLAQTQKLESIGQLAAGIAHEINTPVQYIGDNGKFLESAFRDLVSLADSCRRPDDAVDPSPIQQTADAGVYDYLREEVPRAIEQLLSGVDQVARIVRAMKDFSHPGAVEKIPLDINRAIENTVLVSKNEWKYVAEVTTDLDPDLPAVPCLGSELNQVVLNLIVNAAHAIGDAIGETGGMGRIHIATRQVGDLVEILVRDSGCGIPKAIQARVFDPFFTTKPVGKGTGQGLAIAHNVIVRKHGGAILFESEPGEGTSFIIRLPIKPEEALAA